MWPLGHEVVADERIVARLLEAGADPDVPLKMGETLPMSAARSGDVATGELA